MSWEPLEERPAYTRVPRYLTAALAGLPGMAQARGLCDLARQPVDFWPAAAADILAYGVDHRALLAVDAAASDTYVRRSSIAGAGRGLFAARDFLEGELILPFYGQVVYHDLDAAAYEADRTEEDKRYGDNALPSSLCATAQYWGKRSLQVRTGARFWDAGPGLPAAADLLVSVVPPLFCAAGWANSPQTGHLPNAEFHQRAEPVESHAELVQSNNLLLRVTRFIQENEEIEVCYGEEYDHWV